MKPPTAEARRAQVREKGENFPVAPRWLPREPRRHLHAVYAVTRLIDDIGDRSAGDRVAQLLALRADLALIWEGGTPHHPALRALAATVTACGLPHEPFDRLIEANLVDQRVFRYATFEDLLGYCRLSANPVGRIVLGVFGQRTSVTVPLSDNVCTALQVLEHCQDVAEDYAAGRIYLPQQDLADCGALEEQLATGTPGCQAAVTRQVDRAAALLDEGSALTGHLSGWARIAVAGYAAGGYATLRALRAAAGDVWSRPVTGGRIDLARSMMALLGPGAVSAR